MHLDCFSLEILYGNLQDIAQTNATEYFLPNCNCSRQHVFLHIFISHICCYEDVCYFVFNAISRD